MNAKQAAKNKYAKCKRTGIIYPYAYVGFQHPQRFCYIKVYRNGEWHRDLAKGYDVSNETSYQNQYPKREPNIMIHELKTIQPYYTAIETGAKTFEIRWNDRNFEEGDTVILKEYDDKTDTYSGRQLTFEIGFVLCPYDGLKRGYCIFSLLQTKDTYEHAGKDSFQSTLTRRA